MATTLEREIESYNSFVRQIQDLAYTLAVHLLGDHRLAETILQDTFRASYPLWRSASADFEPRFLRALVQRCRRVGPIAGPPDLQSSFQTLTGDEKAALILVDCLALTCPEAGAILTWPLPRLRRVLAGARMKIVSQRKAQVTAC